MNTSVSTKDIYDITYPRFFSTASGRKVLDELYEPDGNIGQFSYADRAGLEAFARGLELRAGQSVLDVCCGTGAIAVHFARVFGCAITGVDISDEAIRFATERAIQTGIGDRVHFSQGDAGALVLEPEGYDAAYTIDSFGVVPRKWEALRAMFDGLRPGGHLGISDVVSTGRFTRDPVVRRLLDKQGRIYPETPATYARMVRDLGFEQVETNDVTSQFAALAGRWANAFRHHEEEAASELGQTVYDDYVGFFQTLADTATGGYMAHMHLYARKPARRNG